MSEGGRIDVPRLLAGVDIVQVVQHYGVSLQRKGPEYVGRCIWHAPDEHPSMRVIPSKQLCWCHACGSGGDAIDFIRQVEGVDFKTACTRLNGGAPDWTAAAPIRERVVKQPPPDWESAVPPEGVDTPDMALRVLGTPTHIRAIRTLGGDLWAYECRYPRDAEGVSPSRVWSWGRAGEADAWHWACRVLARPRPLYGLERLAGREQDRVCITEGPQKADAAAQLMPTFVCLSWTGGAQAWKYHDWAVIAGRTVLLWPDSDNSNEKGQRVGVDAMLRCGEMLALLQCNVHIIIPEEQDGWDAADALAEGWDWPKVREWIRPRMRAVVAAQPEEAPVDAPQSPQDAITGVSEAEPIVTPIVKPARPPRAKPDLGVVDGSVVRAPRTATDVDGEPLPVALSDGALANHWLDSYGADWRWVDLWGQWLKWQGDTWQEDVTREAKGLCVRVCQAAAHWQEARELTAEGRRKLSGIGKAGAVYDTLRCNQRIAGRVDQWDCDPWLLGVPGGVVDLRTGELLEGRREDYIRLQAAVAPADPEAGEMPLWTSFLERVQPDPEVRAYLRRLAGYCLTGLTRDHVLAFMYGGGANGKSTFLSTLSGVMGSYAKVAAMSTFSDGLHGHPEEIARLQGARLVSAEETGSGSRWDEGRIKELTGGTPVTAHFMRQNSFSFTPSFTLLFAGNHLPQLRSVGEGMRRRLHLVPWSVQIPVAERDTSLCERLRAEWPAILRWAIVGCLEYQAVGLAPPPVVLAAAEDYLADEDHVGQWRIACTEDAPGDRVQSSDLYRSYVSWMERQGEKPQAQRVFSEALSQAGCTLVRSHGVRYVKGLRLRPVEERMPGAPVATGRDWE